MIDPTENVSAEEAAAAVDAAQWPEPERIGSDLPPVPKMDAEALLPEPLAGYVMDAAYRKAAPPEFVAVALLVALGSLIGARCGVRPKLLDDWIVVPNLWGAIVAPPSSKKTPSMDDGIKPLNYLSAKARERFAKESEAYIKELEGWEARMKGAKKRREKAAERGNDEALEVAEEEIAALEDAKPKPPTLKRYTSNDSTIEALGELLIQNPKGLATVRDELVGLLASFERSGHEGDRSFYLEAWNGLGSHEVDRIGRGSLYIPNVCLAILGGIQPERLERYLDSSGRDVGNDGLLARFQLTVWPDPVPFAWRDTLPDKGLRDAVYRVFEVLDDDSALNAWGAEPADRFRKIPSFKLSAHAAADFVAWTTRLHNEIMPGLPAVLQEHFGKYEKLVASLALILDMVERADQGGMVCSIREEPMARAIAWAEFLGEHAKRLYHIFTHPEVRAAQRLGDELLAHKLPGQFTVPDVQRKGWAGLGNPQKIIAALEFLATVGWVRAIEKQPGPAGGRPSTLWAINPKIYLQKREGGTYETYKTSSVGLVGRGSAFSKNNFADDDPSDYLKSTRGY